MIKREIEIYKNRGINEAGIGLGRLFFITEGGERYDSIKNIKELRKEVLSYTKKIRKELHMLDSVSINFQNNLVVCDFISQYNFEVFYEKHWDFYNNYNLFIVRKEFKKNILNESISRKNYY